MSVRLSQVVVALEAQTQKFDRAVQASERRLSSMKTAAAGLGATLLATFGGRQIIRGVNNLLVTYGKQEQAERSLLASLNAIGYEGTAAFNQLADHAALMQRQFKQADEVLIEATSTLAQLAPSLSIEDLEKAQVAMVGLADTFLKGDVEGAARLMGKTFASTTNALTRYGIEVDSTADAHTKLEQIMSKTDIMLAASEARGKTLLGRIRQLNNSWGDFKEKLGQAIAEGTHLGDFLNNVADTIDGLGRMVEDQAGGVAEAFKTLGQLMGDALLFGLAKSLESMPDMISGAVAKMPIIGKLTFLHRKLWDATIGSAAEAAGKAIADEAEARFNATLARIQAFGGAGGRGPGTGNTMLPGAKQKLPWDVEYWRTGGTLPEYGGIQLPPAPAYTGPGKSPTEASIARNRAYFESMNRVVREAEKFQTAANIASSSFEAMVDAVRNGSRSIVEAFANMIGQILSDIGAKKGGTLGGILSGIGSVLSFQEGGIVPGIGNQPVPAIVHPGETVLPKGYGGRPTIVLNQTVQFNASGFVGADWWQQNKGHVVRVVAEAAQEAPAFARALRG